MRTFRRALDEALEYQALGIVAIAVWPRLARYGYAPAFASPVGVACHIAIWTVLRLLAVQQRPRAIARKQRFDATWEACCEHLGRRPTPEEFWEAWKRTQAMWRAAGRPL